MARRKAAPGELRQAGIDVLAREMGIRLGLAIGSALAQSMTHGLAQGRTAVGSSPEARPCRVERCTRRAVAKGLCATHYRKAHRIGLRAPFDARALAALSVDGRKARSGR